MDRSDVLHISAVVVVVVLCIVVPLTLLQDSGNEDVLQPLDCIKTNEKFEELFNTTITGTIFCIDEYNKPVIIDIENNRFAAMDATFLNGIECKKSYWYKSPSTSNVSIYHKNGGIFYGNMMDLYYDRYYGRAVQDNGSIFAIDAAFDTVINYTALKSRLNREREDCFTYPNITYSVIDVEKGIRCNDEHCYPIYDVFYGIDDSFMNVRFPSDVRRKSNGYTTITRNDAKVYISLNASKLVLVEVYQDGHYKWYKWELHVTPEMLGYDDWVREAMQ